MRIHRPLHRRIDLRAPLFALLASLLFGLSGAARADCPQSSIEVFGGGAFGELFSTEAARETTVVGSTATGSGAYDLLEGTMRAHVSSQFGAEVTVRAADRFVVVGTPGAPAVSFLVELRMHGSTSAGPIGSGSVAGCVAEVGGPSRCVTMGSFQGTIDTTMRIGLTRAPGDTFTLSLQLQVGAGEASTDGSAMYRFVALPSGINIVSCQGYDNVLADGFFPPAVNAHRMRLLVDRNGWIGYDAALNRPGLEYPINTRKNLLFLSGLQIGALVEGHLRVSRAEYSNNFVRGVMVGGTPDDPTRSKYRVYKLLRSYADPSSRDLVLSRYNEDAVPMGAPVVSVEPDGSLDIGADQLLWDVYNDRGWLGVEVQQTTLAYGGSTALENSALVRMRIINQGPNTLDDTYLSFWSDPNLGGSVDDVIGSDPGLGLAYAYNASDFDDIYLGQPPALGFDLLQGPRDPASSERLGATAVTPGTPGTIGGVYNLMRGLSATGAPFVDPTTGLPTTFIYPGDPTQGTGWIDPVPDDERMMISTGPFRMAPGDTQEVVFAIIAAQGTDRLNSITLLKQYDSAVQEFFDNELPTPVLATVLATDANEHRVRITWSIPTPGVSCAIQRTASPGAWEPSGSCVSDGSGRAVYEDDRVEAGHRYGYRILMSQRGTQVASGEVWVDVPEAATFALTAARPNPATDALWISFSLSAREPARLDLLDVQGRKVSSLALDSSSPGSHLTRIPGVERLAAGVYVVRLSQGQQFKQTKIAIVR